MNFCFAVTDLSSTVTVISHVSPGNRGATQYIILPIDSTTPASLSLKNTFTFDTSVPKLSPFIITLVAIPPESGAKDEILTGFLGSYGIRPDLLASLLSQLLVATINKRLTKN